MIILLKNTWNKVKLLAIGSKFIKQYFSIITLSTSLYRASSQEKNQAI